MHYGRQKLSGSQVKEITYAFSCCSARTKTASDWSIYSRDFTPVHLVTMRVLSDQFSTVGSATFLENDFCSLRIFKIHLEHLISRLLSPTIKGYPYHPNQRARSLDMKYYLVTGGLSSVPEPSNKKGYPYHPTHLNVGIFNF